MITRKR